MKLSHNAKILALLLLMFIACGILLTPLGFETRASAVLGNPASLPWLGLGFSGLILNAVSLILLFVGARIASILATIGSIGSAFLFLADQAGVAVSIRPPPTNTAGWSVAAGLVVGNGCFAFQDYRGRGPEVGRGAVRVCGGADRVEPGG